MCKCDAKQDQVAPPAKRQRIEISRNPLPENNRATKIPTDPLQLPEPCRMRVLQFLTPKELIDATTVSKEWKRYIESSSKVMTRAMNGTIFSIDYDCVELSEVFSSQFEREYKHMKIIAEYPPSWFQEEFSPLLLYPAIRRLTTLESLSISLSGGFNIVPNPFFASQFPNLVKLELNGLGDQRLFEEFPARKFPQLTTLKITIEYNDMEEPVTIKILKKFLHAFPNLKHLELGLIVGGDLLNEDDEPLGSIQEQPKLETAVFVHDKYHPTFFNCYRNSLIKLEIGKMDARCLSICLRDFKQLRILSILTLKKAATNEEIAFPQNDSIKVLKIDTIDYHLTSDQFHEALIAFTSLKVLAVYDYYRRSPVNIRFLGKAGFYE